MALGILQWFPAEICSKGTLHFSNCHCTIFCLASKNQVAHSLWKKRAKMNMSKGRQTFTADLWKHVLRVQQKHCHWPCPVWTWYQHHLSSNCGAFVSPSFLKWGIHSMFWLFNTEWVPFQHYQNASRRIPLNFQLSFNLLSPATKGRKILLIQG